MRPLFRGEGCAINEAGISTSGNQLSRFVDGITNDPMHAQQLRDGYLGGARHPAQMLGPAGHVMAHGPPAKGSLEEAWQDARGPMDHGPMMGDHMKDQFMRHLHGGPPGAEEMFFDGPLGSMGVNAPGPDFSGGMMMRPPGPQGADMAQMEAAWAQAAAQRGPASAPMDAMSRDVAPVAPEAAGPGMMRPMMMGPPMGMMMNHMPPMGMMRPSMPMSAMPMSAMPAPAVEEPPSTIEAPLAPQPARDEALEAAWQEATAQQAAEEISEDADLAQAAQMVEMLRNSGNPKFRDSQFVNFIDKVAKRELHFKDNTVVDRNGQEVNWDDLYDTAAATATESEQQELQGIWQSATSSTAPGVEDAAAMLDKVLKKGPSSLEEMYGGLHALGPMRRGGLEAGYGMLNGVGPMRGPGAPSLEEMMQSAGDVEALESMWGRSYDAMMEEEYRLAREGRAGFFEEDGFDTMSPWQNAGRGEHKFAEDNPYVDHENPLAEAQRLIREGRDREALLCLEAEVQRNPDSSEGWRLLGQLFAELDQDVEAIQCLRKGHEADPYNLDSLLALGVSCTNELDQPQALKYLRTWIENHEEYQALLEGLAAPPSYEFEAWRSQVRNLFLEASRRQPTDSDVFVALGVIENISRNYEGAILALAQACRLRPTDHTAWNKLGATLANSGKSEQAVIAYHQGLQLKPNYARSWSNLAIAHANLGQHEDAARFYLSSLVLNPDAAHNWNFLHSAAINMEDQSVFQAIDARDLEGASKLIPGVLNPNELPARALELPEPPDAVLARMGLDPL
mmetsp:Transcript_68418/g.164244  ORF Transcript_68418/g.164244 Transcript_68418/m.164244 type:complete len:791 (-) Transcript_68418:134-2506(-)